MQAGKDPVVLLQVSCGLHPLAIVDPPLGLLADILDKTGQAMDDQVNLGISAETADPLGPSKANI